MPEESRSTHRAAHAFGQQKHALSARRGIFLAGLFVAELLTLAVLYQFVIAIDCYATDAVSLCRGLRGMLGRGLALVAAAAIIALAHPEALRMFLSLTEKPHARVGAARSLHLLGLFLLFLPASFLAGDGSGERFLLAAAVWGLGGVPALLGAFWWLAPWAAWRTFLSTLGWRVWPALVLALLIPELSVLAQPVWDLTALTQLTFALVVFFLRLASDAAFVDADALIVGVKTFAVHIAPQCSGVEGFVLVAAFVGLYGIVFHKSLKLGRYFTLVLPLALIASWALNAFRIAALVLLGAHVSPRLAVDGFHSYAGWLFFLVLALTIVVAVHHARFLHQTDSGRAEAASMGDSEPPAPLSADPVAFSLIPFGVFAFSGVIAGAFFEPASAGYPLRVALGLSALLLFWRQLAELVGRIDPVAVLVGLIVGLAWVFAQTGLLDPLLQGQGPDSAVQGAEIAEMLAHWSLPAALGWALARGVGTVLIAPLVEEAFFRGYVLARLDRGGVAWRVLALFVSSALFAALHERWVLAGLAGLAFALVYLRRHQLWDAVVAHAVANAVVLVLAASSNNWGLI